MSAVIAAGSRVRLRFRLTLADGTPVEQTGEEPLACTIGDGQFAPGLERCLLGLQSGQRGRFELAPLEDFGPAGEAILQRLPRAEFAESPEPGAVIAFATPSGEEQAGTIVEVLDEEVVVDFAHPLAGHALVFEVEIVAVEPPAAGD
jgi:FKBP-type peptidyl-prolyl cis-trans isomerase SlpA